MYYRKKKIVAVVILLFIMQLGMLYHTEFVFAEENDETTTLRIISTTDMHSQLADDNYETAGARGKGSLAQVSTLIKEARSEVVTGTSITVDCGDTIYGYGSDYVVGQDWDTVHFMYAAMSSIGYDAITLGNHDFDYGYLYVKNQLSKVGMTDQCVVSNVYDAVTKQHVWNANKMIKKIVTTSKGNEVCIQIGIVGAVPPTLTTYYNHKGILTTKGIVESVAEQAKKLKEEGADVVLAVVHSGFGTENPSSTSSDAVYALTKVSDVDAVMCGHSHANFPSTDEKVSSWYNLPNIDKATGLVNGKTVVMVADRGTGIGIADLDIKVDDGKFRIINRKSNIIYTQRSTEPDPEILKYKSLSDAQIKSTYKELEGDIGDSDAFNNYFATLSDNAAVQMNNEAKIQYGLKYTHTEGKEYAGYPVIGVTNYKKAGAESKEDYVDIKKTITLGDVLSIQSYYHNYACIYRITGKQLREWLELTASAYEEPNKKGTWSDKVINDYVNNQNMSAVLKSEWMNTLSNFNVFDGIEYEIDVTKPARYNRRGTLIDGMSHRIVKLTCNGKDVTDDMQFVLVSDIITSSTAVIGKELSGQRLKKGVDPCAYVLREYIRAQNKMGSITQNIDRNWRVLFPVGDNYVIQSSALSEEIAKKQTWYQKTLKTTDHYAYYQGSFGRDTEKDISGPSLVVTQDISEETNKDITVYVQATDASQVTVCKYLFGKHDISSEEWKNAGYVVNGSFIVKENGIYSVLAEDSYGNSTVKYIDISQINRDILQVPQVNNSSISNKMTQITGMAEPNAEVTLVTETKTYKATVKETGEYEFTISPQKAGSVVKFSVEDSLGRKSKENVKTVIRSGPNCPTVQSVNNKATKIKGTVNDENTQIYAVIGSKVYVSDFGGTEAYKGCANYNENKKIVLTDYEEANGTFAMTIPVQRAGQQIKIYAIDCIGRVSKLNSVTVKEVAPDKPELYSVCDVESYVFGYVPTNTTTKYGITVTVNGKKYTGSSSSDGHFAVKVAGLEANKKVYVTASDNVNGNIRTSVQSNKTVASYKKYEDTEKAAFVDLMEVTDKDSSVKGEISDYDDIVYVKAGNQNYEVKVATGGAFKLDLEKPLSAGDKIYVVLRNEYSDVEATACMTVVKAVANKPKVLNSAIYNTTKEVQVISEEKCKAVVKVGSREYTQTKCSYSNKYGGYNYKVKIERSLANKNVKVYMENSAGNSKSVSMKVQPKAPEILKVSKVTEDSKKLTGKVTLVLPKDSSAKKATVKNTGTKVYVKINGKRHKCNVKDDGTFYIKWKEKKKKGTKVSVYASNTFGGNGEKIDVVVSASKKKNSDKKK